MPSAFCGCIPNPYLIISLLLIVDVEAFENLWHEKTACHGLHSFQGYTSFISPLRICLFIYLFINQFIVWSYWRSKKVENALCNFLILCVCVFVFLSLWSLLLFQAFRCGVGQSSGLSRVR